ncbi:MAG: hypothetical protein QOJ02_718 [Acidobacteriota bacterium]|jgi:hypothetical protein|nr:hypothetical protein [Acidobacteriota bacterium]
MMITIHVLGRVPQAIKFRPFGAFSNSLLGGRFGKRLLLDSKLVKQTCLVAPARFDFDEEL